MSGGDIELLTEYGWIIVTENPFVIRNPETHSFATREAAEIILESYKRRKRDNQSLSSN